MKRIALFLLISSLLYGAEDIMDANFIYKSPLSSSELQPLTTVISELNHEIDSFLRMSSPGDRREIQIFINREDYHKYLESLKIPLRDDYILLEYSDRSSRLIIYREKSINRESLLYHMTLQYIDHYSINAPKWFSKGLALNILKKPPHRVMEELKKRDYNKVFQNIINTLNPDANSSWMVVYYLLHSGDSEKRLLWETLSKLHYDNEYTEEMLTREFNNYNLDRGIKNLLDSSMGYSYYMDEGIKLFNEGKFSSAKPLFEKAAEMEPMKYSPIYYLGMVYNGLKDYNNAYNQFSMALDKNAPADLLYYSIGLNFYQQKEFKQALNYLEKIKESTYKVMAEEVINAIKAW